MRLVFAGTPEPAVVALERLIDSRHEVVAVITQPDARRGRGRKLTPSPVGRLAEERGIETLKPETLKADDPRSAETRQRLAELAPDCLPVVAYGRLVPEDLLKAAPHGWVNLHFSLLPRWRGAAPVQAAIAAGDEETGATTFRIDGGLDTGEVLGTISEQVGARDTADDLLTRLAHRGAGLLVETMDALEDGSLEPTPQRGEATYASKIAPADARVDWSDSAESIDRRVRAHTPGPGAWTTLNGERVKLGPVAPVDGPAAASGAIWRSGDAVTVACGSGAVELSTIQPAGKKPQPAADWARGLRGERALPDAPGEKGPAFQ
ncbi:methionyl-tRNA formyltransferase [Corynebacterium otitidis]|nr:methionyl-tRNA formyltransferase [Corynebacterium otitidis]EJZ82312.1 methionyl-tRNA formyltransferase [Corynebacterium otitidis ATCC 51513]